MLKTLKNQSKSKILAKAKIKEFIKRQLWVYALVIASILVCSWIFDKWVEGILFCVAHICIRRVFDKQFHFKKTLYCVCLTLVIIWFAIPITLPIGTSLLSSIPVAFGICLFGYFCQDRLDARLKLKQIQRQKAAEKIYSMTELELRVYCQSKLLDEIDQEIVVQRIIYHLKGQDLYSRIGYSKPQMIRREKRIESKLNIKLKDH